MLHRTRVGAQPCIPACSALPCRRGACYVVRNRSAAVSVHRLARMPSAARARCKEGVGSAFRSCESEVRFCFHSVGGRRTSAMPRRSTSSAGAMRARMAACRMRPAPCHICTGTGLTPATSAPGLGAPLPHLRRDWAHACHVCTGTASFRRRLRRSGSTGAQRGAAMQRHSTSFADRARCKGRQWRVTAARASHGGRRPRNRGTSPHRHSSDPSESDGAVGYGAGTARALQRCEQDNNPLCSPLPCCTVLLQFCCNYTRRRVDYVS
jgi:hypothetical protein